MTSPDTEIEADVLSSIATLKRAILPIEALAGLDMTYLEELTVLADRPYIISATVFASATALRSLTLDSRVTGFVEGAFANCTLLSSVTLDPNRCRGGQSSRRHKEKSRSHAAALPKSCSLFRRQPVRAISSSSLANSAARFSCKP